MSCRWVLSGSKYSAWRIGSPRGCGSPRTPIREQSDEGSLVPCHRPGRSLVRYLRKPKAGVQRTIGPFARVQRTGPAMSLAALVAIIFLLFANGFFVAAEFAFTAASRPRLAALPGRSARAAVAAI